MSGIILGWFCVGGLDAIAGNSVPITANSPPITESRPPQPPLKQIRVTTLADTGMGSLRWAIAQANAAPDDDLIDLSSVQGAIALQSPLPTITSNLTLVGNGNTTISGNQRHRVLQINGGDVTIRDLTLADGLAQGIDGIDGAGGSAGMGGGLLINQGAVRLSRVKFVDNQAIGGSGSPHVPPAHRQISQVQIPKIQIQSHDDRLTVNRGAILDIDGISLSLPETLDRLPLTAEISRTKEKIDANRGAIAGVSGIGINGIGSIAFGGGGGFGGFGNAGNGGNGGNGGTDSGNGGNGGDGGNGGVGIFGSFARWEDQGSIGTIVFGGGGGFGGFGNAGNGGNGGNATVAIANGGNGGNGGDGGFGGGGGAGGFGGRGGSYSGDAGQPGQPGSGGFGGGDGGMGFGGSGGGFGGAILIRSGHLVLNQVQFIRNAAIAGSGPSPGQGKGGAIFITPSPIADKPPSVLALGNPIAFIDNVASDAAGLPTDNDDIYGVLASTGRLRQRQ
ncbi:MAG: hypothetical protein AAFX95_21220 [Cyanobacteria bacterium J06639_16]